MNASAPREARTKTILAMLALLAFVFAGDMAYVIGESLGIPPMFAMVAARTVVAIVAFVQLGGAPYLALDRKAILEGMSIAKIALIVSAVAFVLMSGLGVYRLATGAASLTSLPSRIVQATLLLVFCLLVGMNEELGMRGLLFGGGLARYGTTRNGILLTAGITSLLFGFVHIFLESLTITSWVNVLQAVLKTTESALFSFILCTAMLKTKNIVGPILVHALSNWLILAGTVGTSSLPTPTSYLNQDQSTAIASCIVYLITCLAYLPSATKAFGILSHMTPPQTGPFMGETSPEQVPTHVGMPRHSS